jgi:hypothetical protein
MYCENAGARRNDLRRCSRNNRSWFTIEGYCDKSGVRRKRSVSYAKRRLLKDRCKVSGEDCENAGQAKHKRSKSDEGVFASLKVFEE